MKTNTLILLVLALMIPVMATGAEIRTVNVEFSFTPPVDPTREHLGYRLYQKGEQVCETNDPAASRISCEIFTEEDTFDFTLMAYYSDYTESPPSPSFPLAIGTEAATLAGDMVKIEVGEVSIDHEWVKVLFAQSYTEPVVIAGPPTVNGSDPVLARIRNIDQEGFEIRLQEWDYLDDWHVLENVNYMVIEAGVYALGDGIKLEAGSFTGSSSYQKVMLQQDYTVAPIIMSQVLTENETDAVTNRIQNSNQYSFDHKLQEQETTMTNHTTETIGYIAWTPGQGQVGNLRYETGVTAQDVDHNWFNLVFKTALQDLPFFFAGMQTTNGGDSAAVRSRNMSNTAIQVKVEEEQSKDSEVDHVEEVMGYFTIGAATN